jgi:DNA-binding IscR family transcriptional regulator
LLARPADRLTVGDVLRFVEGAHGGRKGARRKHESPFSSLWGEVDRAVSEVVDRTSFADLQSRWAEQQNKFVHNWEI